MKFEPTLESVSRHKVPEWYGKAKFGIFIHWSLFSVPAYAPTSGQNLAELSEEGDGFANSMKNSPYAEWYLNTSRIEGSPTQEHHRKTYGESFNYFNFQKSFEEQSRNMKAGEWADFFKEAGAQYVVLVTKHHDGYCLWPSEHKNPFMPEYQSKRDLVGEITDAVRSRGMKMGLYYSGIFDWTFKNYPIDGMENWVRHQLVTDQYSEYATAHMYELIQKYKPSILWNDIGYPQQYNLDKLFSDYYNAVPEGVVNDRWRQYKVSQEHSGKDIERLVERLNKELEENGITGILKTDGHHDYTTPEYESYTHLKKKKWEMTRGMGMSFGYNQVEGDSHMLTAADVVYMLIDAVSKNGNVLINVGPKADGTIPEMQKRPLLEVGKWLKINGEAIYGTTYLDKQEGISADGKKVAFTRNGDNLYAMVMDKQVKGTVVIKDLQIKEDARVRILGVDKLLNWKAVNGDLSVELPEAMPEQLAYTIKIG